MSIAGPHRAPFTIKDAETEEEASSPGLNR